jgi:hypothetical protein
VKTKITRMSHGDVLSLLSSKPQTIGIVLSGPGKLQTRTLYFVQCEYPACEVYFWSHRRGHKHYWHDDQCQRKGERLLLEARRKRYAGRVKAGLVGT